MVVFPYLQFRENSEKTFFIINIPSLSDQSGRQSEYETAARLINLTVDLKEINTLLEKNPEIRSN